MKSAAIILNPEKTGAVRKGREILTWLRERNIDILAEADTAAALESPELSRDYDDLGRADFGIVMGGDGTLLRASRILSPHGVPMLPIRFGLFGFMTDIEPTAIFAALERVVRGDYSLDERMMLGAAVVHGSEILDTPCALNEVVVSKGPLSRMLHLTLRVSGQYVSAYAGDGLVIATPTGSTAYSLSAGGPLVHPSLKVILITPICPHTLNTRSLIVSSDETVEVTVENDARDVILTVDGQQGFPLSPEDRVRVQDSGIVARLMCVEPVPFYRKLHTRLKWGDRFDCLP